GVAAVEEVGIVLEDDLERSRRRPAGTRRDEQCQQASQRRHGRTLPSVSLLPGYPGSARVSPRRSGVSSVTANGPWRKALVAPRRAPPATRSSSTATPRQPGQGGRGCGSPNGRSSTTGRSRRQKATTALVVTTRAGASAATAAATGAGSGSSSRP